MTPVAETELTDRLHAGKLVETIDQMSPIYLEGIKRILTVSGDTELISAPAYRLAANDAPSTNAFVSAMGIIQDEMAHAHIAYRLLEDLGMDKEWLVYERKPGDFKYPYAFDVPLETWVELVVANALYDRAGYVLLGDVFKHGSFGPWKRALVKVDKEENFHLRHGETWMRKINEQPGGHEKLQRAIDWMLPLTLEWFGLPDNLKRHTEQIEYGFKGSTNDELRQIWMSTAIPFLLEAATHARMVRPARQPEAPHRADRIRLQRQHERRAAPDLDEHCYPVPAGASPRRARALRPGRRQVRHRLPLPVPLRPRREALAVRGRPVHVG